ncbi:serine/threonine dehydratase [Octadecabacter sp. 1_MG-2023]|uniref:serine/threonine dehydratase n=1 Tax=unclassified Octadecabacter TaxID=196158 RepID=UPI001C0925A2|nr:MULTISPECIES: serine/threonine dehydratase [unclassified Octadecabacter]MBU2992453.1 serine/threonine dehydratase [Octadecabacter sp. B2R22]MDO6734790.1 serine/threonine dehydratase [Octadecabacter sp. 1_MG-2023]
MPVTSADISNAADRIKGYVHETPSMRSDSFGLPLQFKLEHTQVTGSFKARGAFNSILTADVPPAGIVAASGGNHGAAVAHAATALGHDAHIFVPEFAGPAKIDVIRQTGANLHIVKGAYSDAAAAATAHKNETGALDIHPYDAPATIAGQGTCFKEWEEQGLDADTVIIAIGGGGLISGALTWLKGRNIIGVETQTTNSMHAALSNGSETDIEVSGICANALGAKRIGSLPFGIAKANDLSTVLVTDDAVAQAQKQIWQNLRQLVEPAGAAGVAAVLSGAYKPSKNEKVAVLLCGANPAPIPI